MVGFEENYLYFMMDGRSNRHDLSKEVNPSLHFCFSDGGGLRGIWRHCTQTSRRHTKRKMRSLPEQ